MSAIIKFNFSIALCWIIISSLAYASNSPVLQITAPNVSQQLTMTQLKQFPVSTIISNTPWTSEGTVFTGVKLSDLAKIQSLRGNMFKVTALNNYWSTISQDDIEKYEPILAYAVNGKMMSVREKGPLWVIFPLSDFNQEQDERLHSQMVWQVKSIDVTSN
jgi:hypothetical protein